MTIRRPCAATGPRAPRADAAAARRCCELAPPDQPGGRSTEAQRPAALRRGVRPAGGARRAPGRGRRAAGDAPLRRGDGLLAAFDARLPFDAHRRPGRGRRGDPPTTWPRRTRCTGCCRARWARARRVVALRAMLTVVDAGGQAALLAPTEVLAQQHHRSITQMLGDLAEGGMLGGHADGTQVRLLTGSQSAAARRAALLEARASGEAGHRRSAPTRCSRSAWSSATSGWSSSTSSTGSASSSGMRCGPRPIGPPHLLVMTATPIPRTVAMTVFGDLETSTLRELPAGRQPITTHVVPAGDRRAGSSAPGSGSARRSTRATRPTSCARGSAATTIATRGRRCSRELDADGPPSEERRRRARAGRPSRPWTCSTQLRAEPVLAGAADRGPARPAAGRGEGRGRCRLRRRARSTCWSPTTVVEVGVDVAERHRRWWSWTPTGSASPSCTSCAAGSAAGRRPGLCLLVSRGRPTGSPAGSGWTPWPATLDGFELAEVDLRAAPRGRRAGRRAVRRPVLAAVPAGAARRGPDRARPGRTPPSVVDADPVLVVPPGAARRARRAAGRGAASTSSSAGRFARRDADHQRRAGRPPARRAGRPRHPADQRPGPRGAVRPARPPGRPRRCARARPVRRLRRARARGGQPRAPVASTFVESDRAAAEVVRRNVARSSGRRPGWPAPSVSGRCAAAGRAPAACASRADAPFDLVLADPPYDAGRGRAGRRARAAVPARLAGAEALVVVERTARSPEPRWPAGLAPATSAGTARPGSGGPAPRRTRWSPERC